MTKVNHSKVKNQSDSEPEFFIGHSKIVYKIDTGTEMNVISKEEFNTLKSKPRLSDLNSKLTAYNNTKIPIAAERELSIKRLD